MQHLKYYNVLGFEDSTPTQEEIKSAYLKKAKEYHPDRNPTDNPVEKEAIDEKFKELQEAYDTLKDDEKRKYYDKYGLGSNNSDEASIKNAAEANLLHLWEQVLDNVPEHVLDQVDFKKLMLESIQNAKRGFENNIKSHNGQITKLQKPIKRIIYKGDSNNALLKMIMDKIAMYEENIKALNKNILITDRVLELLNNYDFIQPTPSPMGVSISTTSASGGGYGGGNRVIFKTSI